MFVFFLKINLRCVVFCLWICLCIMCVSGTWGGRRSLLNLPGLELQMAPSCHVGVENQIRVLMTHSLFKKDAHSYCVEGNWEVLVYITLSDLLTRAPHNPTNRIWASRQSKSRSAWPTDKREASDKLNLAEQRLIHQVRYEGSYLQSQPFRGWVGKNCESQRRARATEWGPVFMEKRLGM